MQEVVWALLLLCCGLCCFTSGSVVSLPVFGLPSFAEFPCVGHNKWHNSCGVVRLGDTVLVVLY